MSVMTCLTKHFEKTDIDLVTRFEGIVEKEKELAEEHLKMLLRVSMKNEKLKGDLDE